MCIRDRNNGYAKARVTKTDVQLNEEHTKADVTIDVSEGEKYNLSSARIVGNLGGMADELQPLLGELHLNDTFSRADVQNVESLIKDKMCIRDRN